MKSYSAFVRSKPATLAAIVLALGTIGADFRVLHPPELVDLLRDWAGRFHRASSVPREPQDG